MLRILITLLIYIVILSILYLFEPTLMFEETGRLNVDINDQTKMVLKLKNKVSTIEKDQKEIVKHIESKYEDATKKVQDLVDFHSEELER